MGGAEKVRSSNPAQHRRQRRMCKCGMVDEENSNFFTGTVTLQPDQFNVKLNMTYDVGKDVHIRMWIPRTDRKLKVRYADIDMNPLPTGPDTVNGAAVRATIFGGTPGANLSIDIWDCEGGEVKLYDAKQWQQMTMLVTPSLYRFSVQRTVRQRLSVQLEHRASTMFSSRLLMGSRRCARLYAPKVATITQPTAVKRTARETSSAAKRSSHFTEDHLASCGTALTEDISSMTTLNAPTFVNAILDLLENLAKQ
ncbi:hypothetical protein OSTOST_20035, partial [Ostertagia ostertagi]